MDKIRAFLSESTNSISKMKRIAHEVKQITTLYTYGLKGTLCVCVDTTHLS